MDAEKLYTEFERAYTINGTTFCFGDYCSLHDMEGKIGIVWEATKLDRYAKEKIILHLLQVLNSCKASPVTLLYSIPDNTCEPEYFPFEMDISVLPEFPIKSGWFQFPLSARSYVQFYDYRYHKEPFYVVESGSHPVQFYHYWISGIEVT